MSALCPSALRRGRHNPLLPNHESVTIMVADWAVKVHRGA
jgi:hypothetical protein